MLAAVLRLAWLGTLPAGLSHDEWVKGYDAWAVLHTGRDQYGDRFPLVFRALGDDREGMIVYLIALSEAIVGPTAFAVRLPTALAGVALVAVTALLGRELLGPRGGLLAALLLALSPWHLQISRLAFRAGLTPLFIALGLWLLSRALRRGGSLAPAGVACGLSLYTYLGARPWLPLLLLGVLVAYGAALRRRPRAALLGALALALTALPLVAWGLSHPARFLGHAGDSAGWREAAGVGAYARQVTSKYLAYLGPDNLVFHGDPYPVPSTGRQGALLWPALPLFLVGVGVAARQRRPSDRLLLWWLLAFPLAPAFTDGAPPDWLRASVGLPVFELLAARGGVALWSRLGGWPTGRRWALAGGSVALALSLATFLHDYATRFPDRAAWAFHDGMAQAVQTLAALDDGRQPLVLPRRVPAIHDAYLLYTRHDPARLHAVGLADRAPAGAWAAVQGFGRVRVCEPRDCCGGGALCLVVGEEPTLPPPRRRITDRTGRVVYTIVPAEP